MAIIFIDVYIVRIDTIVTFCVYHWYIIWLAVCCFVLYIAKIYVAQDFLSQQ